MADAKQPKMAGKKITTWVMDSLIIIATTIALSTFVGQAYRDMLIAIKGRIVGHA